MTRTTHFLTAFLLACLVVPPAAARAEEDRPVLELSLDDVVQRALENNVDIAVQRHAPESSASAVHQAEGAYDFTLTSTLNRVSSTPPQTSDFSGFPTDITVFDFGAFKLLPTGGRFDLTFNNQKQDTSNPFSTFNPSYDSNLTLSVRQPLLRNLHIDQTRQQLRIAKTNREISDVQFRQTVINTVADVKKQYFDLIAAIDNFQAQKKSLALAEKLLDENRIRVRVGTLAPLDVVAAESEVASREEGVIVAESTLRDAEDALRRSIFPTDQADIWERRLVPTERPTAEPFEVDSAAAVQKALEQRTDITVARKNVESASITQDLAKNQTLPSVDLTASYGTQGIGGTQIEREGFGGPVLSTTPGGYGDAFSSVFGRDFPTWTIGVNVSYPIRNRAARASSARARIAREQAEAVVRRLEMQIATEVRALARAVDTNFKRVASTRAARVLQERRLDAEEKKFQAGMSTNFLVTQAQRDLALAEVAELRAIADYHKSLVDFQRSQESGISGSGGSATVSLGTSQ